MRLIKFPQLGNGARNYLRRPIVGAQVWNQFDYLQTNLLRVEDDIVEDNM
jgi:hypothetical protein